MNEESRSYTYEYVRTYLDPGKIQKHSVVYTYGYSYIMCVSPVLNLDFYFGQ